MDSTEFGLVSLGFSFAKNRDWRGNGLEGKEFVRKTTIRFSYEGKIGCKQELAARKNTARLPVNPDLFIKQKGTYIIIYGQNIKKEKKMILSINNMLRLFKRKRIIREKC